MHQEHCPSSAWNGSLDAEPAELGGPAAGAGYRGWLQEPATGAGYRDQQQGLATRAGYSVDSMKRTVHLTFHGLFFSIKSTVFFEKLKTELLIETVQNLSALKISNTYFSMFLNSRSLY